MNTLYLTLLQTGATPPAGGQWQMWVMLLLIFVIMWLFMIRPQRKQQKALEEFRNGLRKGDRIMTAGGIYGKVAEVQEKTLLVEIDNGVKVKVDKTSVVKDYSDSAADQQK